jgi:hypothetical protein
VQTNAAASAAITDGPSISTILVSHPVHPARCWNKFDDGRSPGSRRLGCDLHQNSRLPAFPDRSGPVARLKGDGNQTRRLQLREQPPLCRSLFHDRSARYSLFTRLLGTVGSYFRKGSLYRARAMPSPPPGVHHFGPIWRSAKWQARRTQLVADIVGRLLDLTIRTPPTITSGIPARCSSSNLRLFHLTQGPHPRHQKRR